MNIIIGKNNAGKTRFFQAIKKEYKGKIEIAYIKANDVVPSDNQLKTTADSSGFVKSVSKLFKNLNINLEPKGKKGAIQILVDLGKKINDNLQLFSQSKDIQVLTNSSEQLKVEWVVRSLIENFNIEEKGVKVKNPLKPEEIGQGYQRLLVASILKSYVDIAMEVGTKKDIKEVLLLFEEPELYLHPKLKRTLNNVLKKISEEPKYTIIISTHDPYFLSANLNNGNIQVYSFSKTNNETDVKGGGNISFEIEDEILHINLFNKLIEKMKKDKKYIDLGKSGMKKTSKDMESYLSKGSKLIIKKDYQYDGKGGKYNVLLPIFVRNTIHHGDITDLENNDLEKSIQIMSKILSKD